MKHLTFYLTAICTMTMSAEELEEMTPLQEIMDGQVELYEALDALHERLSVYERAVVQMVDDLREQLTDMESSLGNHHMANYNMVDARLRTLELMLGMGQRKATAEPDPKPAATKAPQLFMAPLLRYIRAEDARIKLIDDMEASGLTGIHLVVQTDWYDLDGPLDFEKMGVRDAVDPETFALIEDIWHRLMQRNPDYHLHIWLYGDSDWWLNSIRLQGPFGPMERMVYDRLNSQFAGFKNLTLGAGWDCHEWLTREHLQQMVDYLDLPLTARSIDYDSYDGVWDFPDVELKHHTTAELEALRARFPADKYPVLFSTDRCRQYTAGQEYDTGTGTWSDPDRHFPWEAQQRVYDDATRLGITVIFGRLGPGLEDAGSLRFERSFR